MEETAWFKDVKPIIMQPPQQTIKDYYINKSYTKILTFLCSYFISKQFNNRYLYYKEVFKNVPINTNTYDVAIAFQGPTDMIDYYIANKVKATKKYRGFILMFQSILLTRNYITDCIKALIKYLSFQKRLGNA